MRSTDSGYSLVVLIPQQFVLLSPLLAIIIGGIRVGGAIDSVDAALVWDP